MDSGSILLVPLWSSVACLLQAGTAAEQMNANNRAEMSFDWETFIPLILTGLAIQFKWEFKAKIALNWLILIWMGLNAGIQLKKIFFDFDEFGKRVQINLVASGVIKLGYQTEVSDG